MDFKNIWKVKGINFLFDANNDSYRMYRAMGKSRLESLRGSFWFNYFTPMWHESRGPYITCGFLKFRIMRGY
jgi:hypothetical protein